MNENLNQRSKGLYHILEYPFFYETLQWLGNGNKSKEANYRHYDFHDGEVVIDVGCGAATMFFQIDASVDYYGFDANEKYIELAKKKVSNISTKKSNCTLFTKIITPDNVDEFVAILPQADKVITHGVLHHLNDKQVINFFTIAKLLLKDNGKCIVSEIYSEPTANFLEKFYQSLDRGKCIRTKEGYLSLAREVFDSVSYTCYGDLLRKCMPPSSIIYITCEKT